VASIRKRAPAPIRHRNRNLVIAAAVAVVLFFALFAGGSALLNYVSAPRGHSALVQSSSAGNGDDNTPPAAYTFKSNGEGSPPAPSTPTHGDQAFGNEGGAR
jgi:hypothetical protein